MWKSFGRIAAVSFASCAAVVRSEEAEDESAAAIGRRNSMRKQKSHYPYVIIGGGTCAHAAIEGIRGSGDTQSEILLLSTEHVIPRISTNDRMIDPTSDQVISDPLLDSYNEWRRHISARLETETDLYRNHQMTISLGNDDFYFDVEKNQLLLANGSTVSYDKCLIATSGKPRPFYVLDSKKISYMLKDKINTVTTLEDFLALDQLHRHKQLTNLTVVGGGFLGIELACALGSDPRNSNFKVQQVFVESYPGQRYLPEYLCKSLADRMVKKANVELLSDRLVTGIKPADDGNEGEDDDDDKSQSMLISLVGDVKEKLHSDYAVLASTHIIPKVNVARQSGLEIDPQNGGIQVNSQLEAVSGLYAAGTAASYYDPIVGRRRVDRFDHAINSGLVAGQNMAKGPGHSKIYKHQPMFRSNVPSIGVLIEGVGEINSNLRTVGIWLDKKKKTKAQFPKNKQNISIVPSSSSDDDYERGVVYYLRGNKIVGILLWNCADVLESARHVLSTQPSLHSKKEFQEIISLGPSDWLKIKTSDEEEDHRK